MLERGFQNYLSISIFIIILINETDLLISLNERTQFLEVIVFLYEHHFCCRSRHKYSELLKALIPYFEATILPMA